MNTVLILYYSKPSISSSLTQLCFNNFNNCLLRCLLYHFDFCIFTFLSSADMIFLDTVFQEDAKLSQTCQLQLLKYKCKNTDTFMKHL